MGRVQDANSVLGLRLESQAALTFQMVNGLVFSFYPFVICTDMEGKCQPGIGEGGIKAGINGSVSVMEQSERGVRRYGSREDLTAMGSLP